MLALNKIYLFKQTASLGKFSIDFVDSNFSEHVLRISNIKLDMSNTIEPISYYKVDGEILLSGTYFDLLKRHLMKIFSEVINSNSIGVYKWDSITLKVKKV